MARARIPDGEGRRAVADARGGDAAKPVVATAVRYTLQHLGEVAPGHTVEVRVPPYAAIQCIEGPRHTRGTPPNVVETDARTWLALASGELTWADALSSGTVHASGSRADLTEVLPLRFPGGPTR
ncbi:hypothetical protein CLV49_2221 [Labedella gwakjiensis]|uniref:Bacterial SCP orthologue domain-containing protein n=1 Tax=Labedella gwakjiensis TaxID=390269 RepID=A0A2P8GX94_9MICO|nr:sterol carrier family protein [Labedella gwakjiensis]PSL38596.1 hypothetical protein CLV49_2221 [Labedella gwakjiensis]RUQ86900.1 hypothetical protein ELQ93_08115 [Labedella gwakjiensis]